MKTEDSLKAELRTKTEDSLKAELRTMTISLFDVPAPLAVEGVCVPFGSASAVILNMLLRCDEATNSRQGVEGLYDLDYLIPDESTRASDNRPFPRPQRPHFKVNDMADAVPTIRTFQVFPDLPASLEPLLELARNLWWVWNPDAVELFRRLDRKLWEDVYHNPVKMLGTIAQTKLAAAANG